ncbi:MAG: amidohydrolase family protein [Ktedonobacteraceae bacterium]
MPDPIVTVDAHQHYWQLQNFEYPWNKQVNLPQMNRDYLPPDILPQMQALGMQYSVLIQADNSLDETAWMLELAQQYPHIAGVVGWIDLVAPAVTETVARLAQQQLLKGFRLMPTPQGAWRALSNGLHALAAHNFVCDLLPRDDTLPFAIEMMHAHPETRFVINHLAGQALTPGGVLPWTEQLKPLAALPNVFMKFSAIQGLADPAPITVETLRPYLASALTLFGAQRLIFASDWPVSTLSGPYAECIDVMRAATATLSADEQAWIWGKTAIAVYRLTLRV